MSSRVVVVGPLAGPSLESSLKNNGHQPLVAEDLRHALLLQRMMQPTALVFPRVPQPHELALLASSASRPVIVVADVAAGVAVDLVRQGVARVVPQQAPPSALEDVLQLPLSRERPVVRALAQLAMLGATGVLRVGQGDGDISVEGGVIVGARSGAGGGSTDSAALSVLASKDAPVSFVFVAGPAGGARSAVDLVAIADDDSGFDVVFTEPGAAAPPAPTAPAPAPAPAPKAPAPPAAAAAPAGRKPRCLVVEDDHDLAQLYRILLRARGFDVEVAHDGDDGFAAARKDAPDVILSDIMMPKVSGWDLLGLVRNDARLRETPFLVFSHHQEMLSKLQTANGGADAYLDKAMRPEAVVAAVIKAAQPLRDLEAAFDAGGERADGVLAGIGPQTLLRLCHRRRLTGRLAVRPAQQRIVVALQDGDLTDAQCAVGATVLRQRDALRALLLADDGPFTFVKGAPAQATPTPLLPLLDGLCAELEQLLDDLRSGALLNGAALKVRKDLLEVYRSTSPAAAQPVLDQLERGGAPRDLIASGTVDLVLVDSVVRDLFRKGVIVP